MNINNIVAECNPFELPSVSLAQRDELPSIVALYFVLHDNRVLYVGATTCLKNRWNTHELKNILFRDRFRSSQVQIAWLEHQDLKLNLKRIEKCAIELFKPVYNRQKFFGTLEWLSVPELWKSQGDDIDSPVDNPSPVSVNCSPLSLRCEAMDGSTVIDRLPVKGLWERYGIHRSLFYRRMKELGIKAHMVGTKGYLDSEQIKLLDDLHDFLTEGENRQTPEFLENRKQSMQLSTEQSTNPSLKHGLSLTSGAIEVKSGIFKHDGVSREGSSKPRTEIELNSPLPTNTANFTSLVHEIAAAIRPSHNPLQHLECLERAVDKGWLLSTLEVKQLIGVKPYGQVCVRGNFAFIRSGKIGNQSAWKVEKT